MLISSKAQISFTEILSVEDHPNSFTRVVNFSALFPAIGILIGLASCAI